jgi:hypothetical protein
MKNSNSYLRGLLSLLLVFSSCIAAKGAVWQTQSAGYWSDGNVWVGGNVPPMSTADTFFIGHAIAIDLPIELMGAGRISIDSMGGICGHTTLTMYDSSSIVIYGLLELDNFIMHGGSGTCEYGGVLILELSASISSNAQFAAYGMMSVGTWFQCELPLYGFLTSVDARPTMRMDVYPNPTNGRFSMTWEGDRKMSRFTIYDMNGRTIVSSDLTQAQGHFQTDLGELPSGYYHWMAMDDEGNAFRGSVVKQ